MPQQPYQPIPTDPISLAMFIAVGVTRGAIDLMNDIGSKAHTERRELTDAEIAQIADGAAQSRQAWVDAGPNNSKQA